MWVISKSPLDIFSKVNSSIVYAINVSEMFFKNNSVDTSQNKTMSNEYIA